MPNKPSMLSVKELFSEPQEYIIPIYQRNYAWELPHLRQLIQDVWDACNYGQDRNYYIGTLVVYPTPKGFETIDGQQRLTTLNIMLSAMKNEMKDCGDLNTWFKGSKLDFEFRKKSSDSLRSLYDHIDPAGVKDENIGKMYEQVRPTIEDVLGKSADPGKFSENFAKFRDYFFNKVIITRVTLPNETELNHYFEIMNTRGEQLEKHEILKARILDPLRDDPAMLWLGSRIWEACSDMNRYAQLGFANTDLRKCVFSDDYNKITAPDFDSLAKAADKYVEDENSSSFSITDLIEGGGPGNGNEAGKPGNSPGAADGEERFSSVIDFPNFLLQTLRVITRANIPLDDKRLLETFSPWIADRQFCKNFLYQLLKLRLLFDKYIIKRDFLDDRARGKWNILKIQIHYNEKGRMDGFSYNNSFAGLQKENIMLQAMFHVSLPSQNYKHWLTAALLHLSKHEDGQGLYAYLTRLSQAYMLDRFIPSGADKMDYYDIIFNNDGKPQHGCPTKLDLPRFDTNIDIFYFNYLDMQLWLKEKAADFAFTSRNSVEHFFPQNPMDNSALKNPSNLHSFGNLCLIGAGENSKLSNYPPLMKTIQYNNDNNNKRSAIDSLKQKKMMDICTQQQKWADDEIEAHAREMEDVLQGSLKSC